MSTILWCVLLLMLLSGKVSMVTLLIWGVLLGLFGGVLDLVVQDIWDALLYSLRLRWRKP